MEMLIIDCIWSIWNPFGLFINLKKSEEQKSLFWTYFRGCHPHAVPERQCYPPLWQVVCKHIDFYNTWLWCEILNATHSYAVQFPPKLFSWGTFLGVSPVAPPRLFWVHSGSHKQQQLLSVSASLSCIHKQCNGASRHRTHDLLAYRAETIQAWRIWASICNPSEKEMRKKSCEFFKD